MTDRPLGIADVLASVSATTAILRPEFARLWLWCRRHEQAHKAGEKCGPCQGCVITGPDSDNSWPDGPPIMDIDCPLHGEHIDIGPFMTEREAMRLSDDGTGAMGYTHDNPLGMEIER